LTTVKRSLGAEPQRSPRAEPLVRYQRAKSPSEAESFLRIRHPKEGKTGLMSHGNNKQINSYLAISIAQHKVQENVK